MPNVEKAEMFFCRMSSSKIESSRPKLGRLLVAISEGIRNSGYPDQRSLAIKIPEDMNATRVGPYIDFALE